MIKLCELCGGESTLYCPADSAFLCRSCDEKVHGANFLVARHIRQVICPNCGSVSQDCVSGSVPCGLIFRNSLCCKSCSSLTSSSTSSLDCVSSCESSSTGAGEKTKKAMGSRTREREERIHGEAEGIFVTWCKKLGLKGNFKNSVVSSACWALSLCLERLTPVLPFRVSLAASFWFGIRISEGRPAVATWQNLRRFGEISGVPRKLIVAVETRLARALRFRRPRVDLEEGWAENHNA